MAGVRGLSRGMDWEVRELSGRAHSFRLGDQHASVGALKRLLDDKLSAKTRLVLRVRPPLPGGAPISGSGAVGR